MERKDYLAQYEKDYYEPATTALLQKTTEYLIANNERITAQLTKELEGFMEKIAKMQKIQPIPAGQIAISVLRTALWEGAPKLRFDCYDAGKEAGLNIAYQYMDADFLFTEWEAYKEALEKGVKECKAERFIREAQLEQYMSRTIERVIKLYVMNLKYYLADADYLEHFKEMQLAEVFIITVGEYLDWQKILYAKVPEIDIVANPKEQPLLFQKISEKKYRDREFTDMDLSQSRFVNCEFSKCTFEQVALKDVRFVNCLFRDVAMKSGSLYGATFIDCHFMNTDMEGMEKEAKPDISKPLSLQEIYRKVSFISCVMDGKLME